MGGGYQRSRHRAWDTSAPQNELRFFIVDALRKRFQANPVPGYTGEPTEVELGDVQATAATKKHLAGVLLRHVARQLMEARP